MILLPFTPNWRSPLKETHQFSTEIMASRSGREQRRALRRTARRTIEFEFLAEGERLRAVDRLMAVSLGQELHLADFTGGVRSQGGIPLGGRTIGLLAVPAWAKPGETVALNFGRDIRAMVVQAVSASSVTFTTGTDLAWPRGAQLCPLLPGRLAEEVGVDDITSRVRTGRLRFDVRPASSLPDDTDAFTRFAGRELLAMRPNRSRAPEVSFGRQTETLDYGRGRIAVFNPVAFTTRVTQSTYLARSIAEARAIVAMFARMRGRRGEFMAPSWTDDLTPVLPASAGATSLLVRGTGAFAYADDPVHRAIVIQLVGGSLLPLGLTRIEASGADTRLQLGSALPHALRGEDVTAVSWLHQARFATDELVMEFVTDQVARFVLSTTTLPFQPAETLSP